VLSPVASTRDTAALATLRIQNRWLNLFFTPLVEYATKSRPLAVTDHAS
jgi:hypothetical protein